MINNKKKSNFTMSFFYKAWLLSIVLFYVLLFITRRQSFAGSNSGDGWWIIWLLVIVAFGALTYVAFTIKTLFSLKKRQSKLYLLANLLTFFSFFALLLNIESIEAKLGLLPPDWSSVPRVGQTTAPNSSGLVDEQESDETQKVIQQQPTNGVVSSKVECTGPDGVVFKTTQKECDDFNVAWGNAPKSSQNTQNADNQALSPCNLSVGTFNLTNEQCLYYTQLDMELTVQQMEYTLDEINSYRPSTYETGSSTIISGNNAELLSECKAVAQDIYQSESVKINSAARITGGGSSVVRALDQLKDELERYVDECERKYPLN